MLGHDAVKRLEIMHEMVKRERMIHEGKLPLREPIKGKWGTHASITGLVGISEKKGKYRAVIYGEGKPLSGEYLGIFANVHSAVDIICRTANIEPLDIIGMTPESWEIIRQQPIIKNKRYGVRNG